MSQRNFMEDPTVAAGAISSLNLTLTSISSTPSKPAVAKTAETDGESENNVKVGSLPESLPQIDLDKVPETGAPREVELMVVERNGWGGYLLFETGSWTLHASKLDVNNCRPGIRVIIAKAETHGPKTTPYTIYVMHIKTAFTIRIISKRYSEYKELDHHLRALFGTAPKLPKKKSFGKMSPKFIAERKRQLQVYIDAVLADPECSNSPPFKTFLGVHGHAAEEQILSRRIDAQDRQPHFVTWKLPADATVEHVLLVVEQSRLAKDVRQEARALNQLAIMHCEAGEKDKALESMQKAIECCKKVDDKNGLLVCSETWACMHVRFGELQAAEAKFREAIETAEEKGACAEQASCHRCMCVLKMSMGRPKDAAVHAMNAIELFKKEHDLSGHALAEFALGNILYACGEVRQAVSVLEHCLLLRRRARDKLGLSEALNALGQAFAQIVGQVHHKHGDHHQALASLEASLSLCVRRDNYLGQADCHIRLADVRLDLGDPRLAMVHLEEAQALLAQHAPPTSAARKGGDDASGDEGAVEEDGGEGESGEAEGQRGPFTAWERLREEVDQRIRKADEVHRRTVNAYEEYERAVRQGVQGEESEGGVVGIAETIPPRMPGLSGDSIVQSAGPNMSKTKPSFPIKFKAKMPGQDMSSHFKFLQSWSVHKKYYTSSAGNEGDA